MTSSNAAQEGAGAGPCLSDELLVDLMEGRLSQDVLGRLHRHAAGCDACRKLMATVARGGLAGEGPARPVQDSTQSLPVAAPPAPPAPAAPPEPEPEPATPWTPPAEFDEFRLGPLLGRGGMGLVYLAQDTSLGRAVAVKFIAASRPRPAVLAHFETEARAIARLQHPNVVTVYRVGATDGHPYIVSEYVVGRSLAHLPVPLPWRRVLTLGLGLARGLAAAHRQGVLHRDLKPSNALVTDDGFVKLLDFGLAEYFDPDMASPTSRARHAAGTPRYMAPELFAGQPASPQSDLYALGVTLYELCTGTTPPGSHSGGTSPGGPEAPRAGGGVAQDLDPEFAALIMHCLASDPAERPASADLLREALERLEQLHAATPLAAGNPYRGLAPFEAEHRSVFFGRDADIRAVIERLRRLPMVLVAGDSGVGKSSLCRAGVLPRVEAGALDASREVMTVTLWPGPRPLQALAAAIAPVLGMKESDVLLALTSVPGWLGPALREAHQERRGLVLFIDQLEELLTQAEPTQAAGFSLLLGELALPSPGVRVLMAVRGDFLTSVSALPGLGDEAERALYILRPMTPAGVHEAIVGPARGRGVSFDSEELVQTLVASMAGEAGSLPLLQFALAELWERRNPAHRWITRAALDAMGGVAGALSRHADGVLSRLTPDERQAARQLLLRLVTAEGTRIERGEEELLRAGDAAPRTALRALTEGRLLHARMVGTEARYVIAHDSLIESWGTLRNWRDRDIGQRAVRERVERASAEWERLSRARETLWGERHIDEARALNPSTLGPREREFLAASQRALRLKRWGRYLVALGVVLALGAGFLGLRAYEYHKVQRFIEGQRTTAQQVMAEGLEQARKARALREEALPMFNGQASPAPGGTSTTDLWSLPEKLWAQAYQQRKEADATLTRAGDSLELALERRPDDGDTRWLLSNLLYERILLAEEFHQEERIADLWGRLERLEDEMEEGGWLHRLKAPATLVVEVLPKGARVDIWKYQEDARGAMRLEPQRSLGMTPIAGVPLPAGSYLLRISKPGHATVDVPVLLRRGEPERVEFALPTSVPDGYVYIPPGCFLLGTANESVRKFLRAAPLHRHCLKEPYLIGRTEVTLGDWVDYLNTLPRRARDRRLLVEPRYNSSGKALSLRHDARSGWTFSFHVSKDLELSAREGERISYPGRLRRQDVDWRKLPLAGVTTQELDGYFYWLSQQRLPGARLCNEHEWEYAARGADGRDFPHGDSLQPDDANIDMTYGREPTAFGPDEVGTHTASASPFGLLDMSGNVYESTRPVTEDLGRIVLRGGAWYYDSVAALTTNRAAGAPDLSDVLTGVRVCAPPAHQ